MKTLLKHDAEFLRFAKRATAGIDSAGMVLGLLTGGDVRGAANWYAFALQVGTCLMDGKPLVLIVTTDTTLPEKLRAAATIIEEYPAGDMEACKQATRRALERLGRPVRH